MTEKRKQIRNTWKDKAKKENEKRDVKEGEKGKRKETEVDKTKSGKGI